MSNNIDPVFHFPVLLYDNYCVSCSKFALTVYHLSKKNVEILGHFDIDKSQKLKNIVFQGYDKDPTRMFWFIKKGKAYASRGGLIQLIKEIIKINLGIVRYSKIGLVDQKMSHSCRLYNDFHLHHGCGNDIKSNLKRFSYLIHNSDKVEWDYKKTIGH